MRGFSTGHLKAGVDSVRSAKLRSFWTMLGIIIGVASVITVVGIGQGVKQQIGGQLHQYGKDLITVSPRQLKPGGEGAAGNLLSGLNVTGSLNSRDVTQVARTKGVAASAPLSLVSGETKGVYGKYQDGYVIGTSPDLSSLLNQSMEFGSFLTPDDMGVNSAVLGKHAAEEMFDEVVPLGRTFTFHGQEFIVRGIFNQFTAAPLSQQANFNNAIFIPYDVGQQLTKDTSPTYQIIAKAQNSKDTNTVASAIHKSLDQSRGGQANIDVVLASQNVASSNAILDLLTGLIAGVAGISLLVGGIGIMNVMLVSVTERMHEIGIRKAVGATNRQILNQFLVESTVISLTGGIIGILLALALDQLMTLYTPINPIITWQVVAVASVVSLLVGIIFGTVPALKAARKDPIDALRYE
jgi:putative ABC transport system permease protein